MDWSRQASQDFDQQIEQSEDVHADLVTLQNVDELNPDENVEGNKRDGTY